MFKSKKMIVCISIMAILVMSFAGTAMAATYNSGQVDNTGQDFHPLTGNEFDYSYCNSSQKSIAGYDWKIEASYVHNIVTTYGIAFKPFCGWMEGERVWLNRVSSSYRYADCQNMASGSQYYYYLKARSDDSLPSGQEQEVSGSWNAN